MTSPKRNLVRNHLASAVVVASLVVLAAGCGSSSSDGASPTTTEPARTTTSTPAAAASHALTEAEWKQEANAICAETGPEIGAAFEAMDPKSPTDAQVAHVIDTLVSVNRDTERRIEALDAPKPPTKPSPTSTPSSIKPPCRCRPSPERKTTPWISKPASPSVSLKHKALPRYLKPSTQH